MQNQDFNDKTSKNHSETSSTSQAASEHKEILKEDKSTEIEHEELETYAKGTEVQFYFKEESRDECGVRTGKVILDGVEYQATITHPNAREMHFESRVAAHNRPRKPPPEPEGGLRLRSGRKMLSAIELFRQEEAKLNCPKSTRSKGSANVTSNRKRVKGEPEDDYVLPTKRKILEKKSRQCPARKNTESEANPKVTPSESLAKDTKISGGRQAKKRSISKAQLEESESSELPMVTQDTKRPKITTKTKPSRKRVSKPKLEPNPTETIENSGDFDQTAFPRELKMGSKRPRKSAEVKEDLSHDGKRQKMTTTTKPSPKQIPEPHSESNAPEVIIIAEESMESKANKDESFQINAELPKSQSQIQMINVKETNISTDLDRTTLKSDLKIGSKRARESTELKQDSIHDGKRLKVASKLT
ncbi:hypothetical protein ACOME3_001122 [Neoechinorhynchus agilis]